MQLAHARRNRLAIQFRDLIRSYLPIVVISLNVSLLSATEHHRLVPMGVGFIHGNNSCVGISMYIEAGDFFEGLNGRETSGGRRFRRNGTSVELYPQRIDVKVLISLASCSASHASRDSVEFSPEQQFVLDTNFIEALQFEGFWKEKFHLERADLEVLTEAEIKAPSLLGRDATWREYELRVLSHEVPLSKALVIAVLSPEGKLVSRFSIRL